MLQEILTQCTISLVRVVRISLCLEYGDFLACFQYGGLPALILHTLFEFRGVFAYLKHGVFFAVILHFLMGRSPGFLDFLALLILDCFSSLFDFDDFFGLFFKFNKIETA